MAAPYNPPIKGQDFIFPISLISMADGRIKTNPTIAAGDFTISKDGGAFASLGTPTVTPAAGGAVMVTVTLTEMTADRVHIEWHDLTDPPEWTDGWVTILTTQ